MAERLKSRVLHREEKFMGTVTMSRFLACVLSGGATFFVLRLMDIGFFTILISGAVFIAAVIFTGDKFGLMRYQWWVLQIRAHLLLTAHRQPASLVAQLVHSLGIQSPVMVRASQIFQQTRTSEDLSGVIILDDDLDGEGFEVLSTASIHEEVSP